MQVAEDICAKVSETRHDGFVCVDVSLEIPTSLTGPAIVFFEPSRSLVRTRPYSCYRNELNLNEKTLLSCTVKPSGWEGTDHLDVRVEKENEEVFYSRFALYKIR